MSTDLVFFFYYYYYLTCHQFVEETKEIWDFWNIILWAFEYCLLPYNLSLGVVSEVTFYKNHLVHVSFNVHKTPECDKLERFVLFDHGQPVTHIVQHTFNANQQAVGLKFVTKD